MSLHVTGPAIAAVPACTALSNTAFVTVSTDGAERVLSSNIATTRVDELLDLRLSGAATSIALAPGQPAVATFELVNAGNGDEAFLLDGRIEGVDAAIEGFALDRDGDGVFDAAVDLAIAVGSPTPELGAGAIARLLALIRGGAAQAQGTLFVHAQSVTGTGIPGSTLVGKGGGGACDAVIGSTAASAEASLTLSVAAGSDTSQVELSKSQAIAAPDGSALPVFGATVTYTIESRFGGGVVRSARLADPIPAGTAYVPGSIRLDGAVLTDSSDGDVGDFDGASVRVALGDIIGPVIHRIQFQVKVQ